MSNGFDASYTAYQANRSFIRRLIRRAYLSSAAVQLVGPTLDFGCGVGELLKRLPPGSKGLEYNAESVKFCKKAGLDVSWYDGNADDWQLSVLAGAPRFDSMVISHVLEHLDAPCAVLNRLLLACEGFGIQRVLVIVPGRAGYRIDPTHRTFVDREMLSAAEVIAGTRYRVARSRYFPVDLRAIGDWLPHHELQMVFVREVDPDRRA